MKSANYRIFLPCARYLETVVAEETTAAGLKEVRETRAGVECRGTLSEAYTLCLWSRSASRVLLLLGEGAADTEKELYETTESLDWNNHFSPEAKFAVSASSSKSAIKNSTYAALKIKDGIADSFRRTVGSRPSVDTDKPDIRIYGRIDGGRVKLYLDFSGESLHKRGYRVEKTEAPMRETAAAGMLLKAKWPEIAEGGGGFVDPMCGSGTLAIEAALIAADHAPGLLREKFGFHAWKGHEERLWNRLREEAKQRSRLESPRGKGGPASESPFSTVAPIFASDKDGYAVDVCRKNIRRAGLEGLITLERRDFRELQGGDIERLKRDNTDGMERGAGLVACNPPYGIRLEDTEKVRGLYEDFGRWLKSRCGGFRAAVLTAGKDDARFIGLRAERVLKFYNGSIEVALAIFDVAEGNEFRPLSARGSGESEGNVISGDVTTGVESIVNRFRKNSRNLKKYLKKHDISCYRLYDADIPQYSAAVDVYEQGHVVIQEYAPPKTVDSDSAEARLKEIVRAAEEFFEIGAEAIFVKQRRRRKGPDQYEKFAEKGEFFIVREGGLRFFVNFTDYLDTGIFLDHRIVRDIVRRHAAGRRVLNLFAYTCTASVYAIDGGADFVESVDTSSTYLEWGKKNFGLNRFSLEKASFVRSDAMEYLRNLKESFGLIFIDPPTFSNRKDATEDFDVQRDHEELIETAGRCVESDGVIIFSNNYRKFLLSQKIREEWEVEDVSQETIPKDFARNQKIHHAWVIRRRKAL